MKKPSPATELRALRHDLRLSRRAETIRQDEAIALRRELLQLRGQLTKAQQDTAEWRDRFDALLSRVPQRFEVAPPQPTKVVFS